MRRKRKLSEVEVYYVRGNADVAPEKLADILGCTVQAVLDNLPKPAPRPKVEEPTRKVHPIIDAQRGAAVQTEASTMAADENAKLRGPTVDEYVRANPNRVHKIWPDRPSK